ncbi:putative quinol monooxygenase [Legionella nautarum]|nr:hypothetical protein [Legionella nautarum]
MMNFKHLLGTTALTLGLITSNYAGKMTMTNTDSIKKATYIKLLSKPETQLDLEHFLQKGAILVRQTEPNTPLWFALKEQNNFAIFDVFLNEKGREQHFAGEVAAALKANAAHLVQDGWEQGVLQNVNNFDIIATNNFSMKKVLSAKNAAYILLKAAPGKSQELEQFLKNAAEVINQTEPDTYLWLALKTDSDTFAIFDTFPNHEALKTHFAGKVAAELQKKAGELIAEGWEKGVLAKVHDFQITAVS